jgi:hypothetical protein
LAGRETEIFVARDRKLAEARERRKEQREAARMQTVDDWQNGFPLLNALGDDPKEWLEQEFGDGSTRLNGKG